MHIERGERTAIWLLKPGKTNPDREKREGRRREGGRGWGELRELREEREGWGQNSPRVRAE